ncbi:MAG: hypothetical protein J5534_14135 [Fibrobacter sp.]|nr:hypothetical protein [Fibrobacter sp.]
MRIICLIFFVILLNSCFVQTQGDYYADYFGRYYHADVIKTDYFEEWGLIRSTGYDISKKWNKSVELNDTTVVKACRGIFGAYMDFVAGRVFKDDSSGKLTIECFEQPNAPVNSTDFVNVLMSHFLKYSNKWVLKDSVFRVVYGGDSIQIASGEYSNHRMICAEKDVEECTFEGDFEKWENDIFFEGPFYEITLPATGRVRSFTVLNYPKNTSAYDPLNVDESLLPLESPGYKKLREQEEKLSRGE